MEHYDPNVIRKRIIIIRPGTATREAIKITITQKTRAEDGDGEILNPTIEFSGSLDAIIESGRFAHDVGVAFLVAAHYHEEWCKYVTGKR